MNLHKQEAIEKFVTPGNLMYIHHTSDLFQNNEMIRSMNIQFFATT